MARSENLIEVMQMNETPEMDETFDVDAYWAKLADRNKVQIKIPKDASVWIAFMATVAMNMINYGYQIEKSQAKLDTIIEMLDCMNIPCEIGKDSDGKYTDFEVLGRKEMVPEGRAWFRKTG